MAGIYIHIPFCASRCPYCDFSSTADFSEREIACYLDCVKHEAETRADNARGLVFDTLFIGGGTPSIVPAAGLAGLVERCLGLFTWKNMPDPEITVEANPDSIRLDALSELVQSGANRLSMGVQDLTSSGLAILGRRHSARQAEDAVRTARKAGFPAVNIDIIYGFPGQDMKGVATTLEKAVRLEPEHISCYELTLAEGTVMQREVEKGRLVMPEEEMREAMTDLVEEYLAGHGYHQYEISNFAKPGFECRHNMDCWDGGQYLGLGCSAVSFLAGQRMGNRRSPAGYMKMVTEGRSPVEWIEPPDIRRSFRELIITGLRTNKGISPENLASRFGIDMMKQYRKEIMQLTEWGMLTHEYGRIRLTLRGRRLANQVLCRFV